MNARAFISRSFIRPSDENYWVRTRASVLREAARGPVYLDGYVARFEAAVKLIQARLLTNTGPGGKYEITDAGRAALEGGVVI